MEDNKKIRVIIADDHEMVRHGFVTMAEKLDFVKITGEAANGKQVIELLRNSRDCI